MHRVVGVFAIVCLNLALQPCAMAMSAEQDHDHDCPHCPPSESQGHHGHHEAPSKTAAKSPCASATDNCGLGDDLNYDGRKVEPKLEDLTSDVAIAFSDMFATTATRHLDSGGVSPTQRPPPDSSPPLNVLYCVYLD